MLRKFFAPDINISGMLGTITLIKSRNRHIILQCYLTLSRRFPSLPPQSSGLRQFLAGTPPRIYCFANQYKINTLPNKSNFKTTERGDKAICVPREECQECGYVVSGLCHRALRERKATSSWTVASATTQALLVL